MNNNAKLPCIRRLLFVCEGSVWKYVKYNV